MNKLLILVSLIFIIFIGACSQKGVEIGTPSESMGHYESELFDKVIINYDDDWHITELASDGGKEFIRFEPLDQTIPAQYMSVELGCESEATKDTMIRRDDVWEVEKVVDLNKTNACVDGITISEVLPISFGYISSDEDDKVVIEYVPIIRGAENIEEINDAPDVPVIMPLGNRSSDQNNQPSTVIQLRNKPYLQIGPQPTFEIDREEDE